MRRIPIFFFTILTINFIQNGYCVLPPWEYEIIRIKSKAVFYGKVSAVEKIGETNYSDKMRATIDVVKVFKADEETTSTERAYIVYESIRDQVKMPIGGKMHYKLKPNENYIVFATSFRDGEITGLDSTGREIENFNKILEIYMLPTSERYNKEALSGRVREDELFKEHELYQKIITFINESKSENKKK